MAPGSNLAVSRSRENCVSKLEPYCLLQHVAINNIIGNFVVVVVFGVVFGVVQGFVQGNMCNILSGGCTQQTVSILNYVHTHNCIVKFEHCQKINLRIFSFKINYLIYFRLLNHWTVRCVEYKLKTKVTSIPFTFFFFFVEVKNLFCLFCLFSLSCLKCLLIVTLVGDP